MIKHLINLEKSILFKDLERDQIEKILNSIEYNIETYKEGYLIAIEEDDCSSLGIILNGQIEIHKTFPSGKNVTINHFTAGDIFGEALIFSDRHKYPATILSASESEVLYFKKEAIVKLMSVDTKITSNFMSVLSNRILMLNDRLTNLSLDTLRKKISNRILAESKKQNSLYIELPYNRKKMAELLNIPRPSLSRELIKMEKEGLIHFNKNNIKILDLQEIEDSLL